MEVPLPLDPNQVNDSVRSCVMTESQVYERFEKLPIEHRKVLAQRVKTFSQEAQPLIVLPKGVEGAEGRPEKWKVLSVDTQRYCNFSWRSLKWIAVCSSYETPQQLVQSAMSSWDHLAVPLCILANRYEYYKEIVCIELPARFGLAMSFIRAQSRANEKQMSSSSSSSSSSMDAEEEKAIRSEWVNEGLTLDSYRSFALQLFQIRQERDPPFCLVRFRGDKTAILWMRDVHLSAASSFYKISSLNPISPSPQPLEHLSWPSFEHRPDSDPPKILCQRAECTACGGLAEDAKLMAPYARHVGPWRRQAKDEVEREMKKLWEAMETKLDGAKREMEGKMGPEELNSALEEMRKGLVEQTEGQRKQVEEKVQQQMAGQFKRCARCKLVRYCSGECQKTDWATHSKYCVENKAGK